MPFSASIVASLSRPSTYFSPFSSRRIDCTIQRPIMFFRYLYLPHAPPSFVMFASSDSSVRTGREFSMPSRDHVPLER